MSPWRSRLQTLTTLPDGKTLQRWSRTLHTWSGLGLGLLIVQLAVTGLFLLNTKALSFVGERRIDLSVLPGHYGKRGPGEAMRVEAMSVSADGSHLATVGPRGAMQSRDGGETWTALAPELREPKAVQHAFGAVWLGHKRGLARVDLASGVVQAVVIPGAAGKEVRSLTLHPQLGLIAHGPELGMLHAADGLAWARLGRTTPTAAAPTSVEAKKVLTDLHTGKFFDGKLLLVYDLTALALMAFVATGVHLWLAPRWKRWRRRTRAVPG